MIPVTKTFLPAQDEYQQILSRSWDKAWITNRGELVKELESKLIKHLGISNILATANGTLPIQIAIKALKLKGEIITTPFSYIATTSSIVWENCRPVFVDIDSQYLTIDENKIEAAITNETSAILATHVFGNPCEVDKIEEIANKYNLRVIYDAAHCFGVDYKEQSVFNYGDVSTCSFHATKIFHTGEGGALICKPELYKDFYFHHNFGHDGPGVFKGLGINAKMSELQAAMGLTVLPYFQKIKERRKQIVDIYLHHLEGIGLTFMKIRPLTDWNYSYFPVIFRSEKILLGAEKALNQCDIFPRRYFYPSLNKISYAGEQIMPVSEKISETILCLPLYHSLEESDQLKIIEIIKASLNA